MIHKPWYCGNGVLPAFAELYGGTNGVQNSLTLANKIQKCIPV